MTHNADLVRRYLPHIHWFRKTGQTKDFTYTYHYETRCRCGEVRWFDRYDEDR